MTWSILAGDIYALLGALEYMLVNWFLSCWLEVGDVSTPYQPSCPVQTPAGAVVFQTRGYDITRASVSLIA